MTLLIRACVSPYLYLIETMSVCRTVFEIIGIKEWRDNETGGRGRSRSLKMVPFDIRLYINPKPSFQGHPIIWRWISHKQLKIRPYIYYGRRIGNRTLIYGRIFNRLWDIQRQRIAWPWNSVRGCSRSLKMAPFDRSRTTFYWSSIVNIALSCSVFELFDVEYIRLSIGRPL